MRDLIVMWGNTRMVVLAAMSASLYAAILIPFKVMPIIPGVTEFRPANAIPVVCSFLFGPAGAWGAAIGNLIGDFFGGLGPGDLFGFLGNLLYGLLPYKLWYTFTNADPVPRSLRGWVALVGVVAIAAGACALVVGWGLNMLGFIPFSALGNMVFFNNFVVAGGLAPPLLIALYPRVKRARLRYCDILSETRDPSSPVRIGASLVVIGAIVSGFVLANLISFRLISVPILGTAVAGIGALQIGLGILPIIIVLLIGASLL